MTIHNPEYDANPICQEFEKVYRQAGIMWADRPRLGGKTQQEESDASLRKEIDSTIEAAKRLRDATLDEQGLRVDEHWGQRDFEVHLVPLE